MSAAHFLLAAFGCYWVGLAFYATCSLAADAIEAAIDWCAGFVVRDITFGRLDREEAL